MVDVLSLSSISEPGLEGASLSEAPLERRNGHGNHVEQTGQCCVEVDQELGSRERIFHGDTGRVSRWVTGVGVSVDLLQDAELSSPGSEYTEHAT